MAIKEKDPKRGTITGTKATVKRNPKTKQLSATYGSDFAGVTNKTLRADRKAAAGTSDSSFNSGPAPRVGGVAKKGAGKVVNYGNSSAISKTKVGKLKK